VAASIALVYGVRRLDDAALIRVVIICLSGLVVTRIGAGLFRAGAAGAATAVCLVFVRVSVLVPAVWSSQDVRPLASLVALGSCALVGGLAAEIVMPGVAFGRRDPLVPGLWCATIGAGIGVMVALSLAEFMSAGNGHVVALAPHMAAATAA